MGFSAKSQVDDVIVTTTAFYPNLSTKKMAADTRLDGAVTTDRLVSALTFAAYKIERELKRWMRPNAYHITLAAYDAVYLTNKCSLYELAVFNEARAMLTESHRDFDSTSAGDKRDQDVTSQIDEFRRNVRNAITMFLEVDDDDDDFDAGFMTVELI